MSRALMSLPAVNPTSAQRRAQHQREFGLGHAPFRVVSNSNRLTGADNPAGGRLEEKLRPVRSIDQVVKRGRPV